MAGIQGPQGDRGPRGALCALSEQARAFGPEETRFLGAAASMVAAALHRLDSEARLAYLAQFDALTGLPNRPLFMSRLAHVHAQSSRQAFPLAVIFLDLDNFKQLKGSLLPPFDRGLSALLEDLQQRGLLDETLVYCLGEFGRTPAINKQAGRDHWAACNTVLLAGGGVAGGLVHGASDKLAAYPATLPVSPADLSATVYQALDVDPNTELRDSLGRPVALSGGRVVNELFG